MGQPIGGLSVRNMRKLYGDGWTAYHEVNIVGIEFCGVLKELSEDYQQLKPIPQVEKMIPND